MELQLDLTKRYTFADYLTWAEDFACELIDGFIYIMSPKPRLVHQEIGGNLYFIFKKSIKKRRGQCRVYYEIDVRFPKDSIDDDKIFTVVSPDIVVICDKNKLDKNGNGCIGAPDLIVEIQSFGTTKYDLTEKYNLYEKNGVPEYWVVYPNDKGIDVFVLQENGKYKGAKYEAGKIPVSIFKDFYIEFDDIFDLYD